MSRNNFLLVILTFSCALFSQGAGPAFAQLDSQELPPQVIAPVTTQVHAPEGTQVAPILPGALEVTAQPAVGPGTHIIPVHPVLYAQDGEEYKSLHLPVYEWKPADVEPEGTTLAIHGLTLHGQSYQLLGRAFASSGGHFVSMDMRGFGRCNRQYSPEHEYCVGSDCKWKINYEKSYKDIVALAELVKKKYPKLPLTVMGESLGATLAVRLAGEHPELVDRMIISAPAVKLSPGMFFSKSSIKSGLRAILISPRFRMDLRGFINNLVSNNPNISKELMDDPLILKDMSLADLLRTESCVEKTIKYARKIDRNLPILIVQGSKDRCVVPDDVVKLSSNTHSGDQTLRWLDNTGHLLLETSFLKAGTITSINDWFEVHEPDHLIQAQNLEKQIIDLGGHIKD